METPVLYKKLFESEQYQNPFVYIESSQIPLTEIPYGTIKQNIIDPTTGKPYKGIILEGVFADLAPILNNNKRIYDIPAYLVLLQILKKQIHSKKGVYGELEHPEGYSVNYNNISHKILDVWYDENEQKVYGRVMLLNTEKGKIAQEIIRSGGCLAISARAAGAEIKQSDGSLKATTKLLTTYDLVYHPGFSTAVLDFKELNESEKQLQNIAKEKTGFSGIIYIDNLKKIGNKFKEFINLNESINNINSCFLEYYFNLNEAEKQSQEEKDEQKLQDGETAEQDDLEKELQKTTEQELKENQNNFFKQMKIAQKKLRKSQLVENKSYYDNSAGFIDTNI
ncbi:hypothetical protein M0Q97_08075 [Candidatus Dojkabacteria bacterium]|jgi:hypothetical protein|nr:hypothetical protein [Candidatus Dojkabacteria bacterium]